MAPEPEEASADGAGQETVRVGDTMVICKAGSSKAGLQVEVLQPDWNGLSTVQPLSEVSRLSLCGAHSLKRHRSIPGHAIAAEGAPTSSPWAMPGGKQPNIRPKHAILSGMVKVKLAGDTKSFLATDLRPLNAGEAQAEAQGAPHPPPSESRCHRLRAELVARTTGAVLGSIF